MEPPPGSKSKMLKWNPTCWNASHHQFATKNLKQQPYVQPKIINPALQPNSVSLIHVKTIWFCIPKQQAVPVLSYWAHVLFFSQRQWCMRSSRKRSVQKGGHLAVLSKVLGTNTATKQLLVVSNLMAANCLLRLQNSCPPNNNLNRSFAPFTLIAIGEMCKVAYTAITARSGQKTIPTWKCFLVWSTVDL